MADNESGDTGDQGTGDDSGNSEAPQTVEELQKLLDAERKHSRTWEGRAKSNKEAADELGKLKQAQMTEQEKLTARAEAAEKDRATLEAQNLRYSVALAKGLPATLAGRLQGSTKEEIEADADELLKLVPAGDGAQQQGRRNPDLGQGQRGKAPAQDPNAWLRGLSRGRGR